MTMDMKRLHLRCPFWATRRVDVSDGAGGQVKNYWWGQQTDNAQAQHKPLYRYHGVQAGP